MFDPSFETGRVVEKNVFEVRAFWQRCRVREFWDANEKFFLTELENNNVFIFMSP